MPIERTGIDGLFVVRWPTHKDERGFFRQTSEVSELEEALGRTVDWRQANHARSAAGVLRGYHADPWDKRVYVTRGTVLAAVADVRPDSTTFGEVATFRLGDRPGERVALFVAEGLANSYCVEGEGPVDYVYDVGAAWTGVSGPGIAWDDPDLAVRWPVASPVLSTADRANPRLREHFPDHPRFAS